MGFHRVLAQALSSLVDLRSAIAEERFWPSEDTSRTQGRRRPLKTSFYPFYCQFYCQF